MTDIPDARPASTVVLLRDTKSGMETLMLKRNKALIFAGGLWVFPGGALDPADMEAAGGDVEQAARLAAAREALEECGLQPDLDRMIELSHWTTPVVEPRRYETWIYAAPLQAEEQVTIDGSEIHEAQWIGVADAVAGHEAGELGMMPPTYVTLRSLLRYDTIEQMLAGAAQMHRPRVLPVFAESDREVVVLFEGDAGYATGNGELPGAQHRAILRGKHWVYVHNDVAADYPAFIG